MMVIQDIIKIRAHHLLCMQSFKGYGYSQDFANNMANVIKQINESPDLEIEITCECDDVCSPCPHNKQGTCRKNPDSAAELKKIDVHILKKFGLKNSAKIKSKNILSLIRTKLNASDIGYICGNCQWKEKCNSIYAL